MLHVEFAWYTMLLQEVLIMAIGERIKEARGKKGYSLEDVAKLVGTSRQTINRYETGIIKNIPTDVIERLSVALGVTPAYLMGWDEEGATKKDDEKDKAIEKLLFDIAKLTPENRVKLADYLALLLQSQK